MSKCWYCENAVPDYMGKGCPWSEHFLPVPGWDAIPTIITNWSGERPTPMHSFDIKECPLFIPSKKQQKILATKE